MANLIEARGLFHVGLGLGTAFALPPVLLAMFENMLFGTNYIGRVVQRGFDQLLRFNLDVQLAFNVGDAIKLRRPPRAMPLITAVDLLESPKLWVGLAAAALMLVLVIRLRRYRDDS